MTAKLAKITIYATRKTFHGFSKIVQKVKERHDVTYY